MVSYKAGRMLNRFDVYSRVGALDASGRVGYSRGALKGRIRAFASAIDPNEQLTGHQLEHPATHRLIVRGKADIVPGDVLERDGERYFVSAVRDVGLMGLFTVLICVRREV